MNEMELSAPLLRLYDDVINRGRMDVLEEIYHPSYTNHAAPFGLGGDLDGLRVLLSEFRVGFPDQHIEADEVFTIGDRVIARWTLRATHLGLFFGVPGNGKQAVMTGIDIERVEDGRIVEHWGGEDMFGFLQQLGITGQMPDLADRSS